MTRKKKDQRLLPNLVTMPNGERFVATLMRVQCRYEDGTPEDLTLMHKNTPIEINGGEEFVVAYIREDLINR